MNHPAIAISTFRKLIDKWSPNRSGLQKKSPSSVAHIPLSLARSSLDVSGAVVAAVRAKTPVILVHGRAGTGKTTLIRTIKNSGLRHVVVAPTGIAALNAGGQTIHSFFGIPPRIVNLDDIEPKGRLRSIVSRLDVLIIDEISMVRADLLDVIDRTLRVNLQSSKPFGGLPIMLVGDFLQLPPIVNEDDAEILEHRKYDVHYAFGAKCLGSVPVKVLELDTVYRQTDPHFIELLGQLRLGENVEANVKMLNGYCHREHRKSAKPVILTSRTAAAEAYNRAGLEALPGKLQAYAGFTKDNFRITKDRLPAPEHLELKVGARIMMVKNDTDKRWVNGSLGTVAKLTDDAVWVRLDGNAKEHQVHMATWESVEYKYDAGTQRVNPVVVGTYSQLPIQPAWAMTVHKAQGLTLEDVRIDLGQGAFSPGHAYVALSRVRSLDGLSFGRPLRNSDVISNHTLVQSVKKLTGKVN